MRVAVEVGRGAVRALSAARGISAIQARCGRYNDASNYLRDCLKRRHTEQQQLRGKHCHLKWSRQAVGHFFFFKDHFT